MDWNNISTSALTALVTSGILTALLTSYIEKIRNQERRRIEKREEQYKEFLEGTLTYFKGWEDEQKQKQFLQSLHASAPLFASDEIVKLSYEFARSFDLENPKSEEDRQTAHGELVLAIRKEMNKLNGDFTELSREDFKVLKLN